MDRQYQELMAYPSSRFGMAPSNRWISLCSLMREYQAPPKSVSLDRERKWEMASALQKSIRRADMAVALSVVSAIADMPDEYGYFWKRLCVTACEDVGLADDELVKFVVACSSVFTPKRTGAKNYDLLCFLVAQMCGLHTRSRVYCSLGIIQEATKQVGQMASSPTDAEILSAIAQREAMLLAPANQEEEWMRANDWRAERLLRFIGLRFPMEMIEEPGPMPPYQMLFGLPSYCYDLHTRVGKQMLNELLRGARGAVGIKEFFLQYKIISAQKALGYALFFAEGGRIEKELLYAPLCDLEQRLIARQHGLALDTWVRLMALVKDALATGIVDEIRNEELQRAYGNADTAAPFLSSRPDRESQQGVLNFQ